MRPLPTHGVGPLQQDLPRDIRPQVFAKNSALGSALDEWAALGRHLAPFRRVSRRPSTEQRCRHFQHFREPRLRASLDCKVFGELHDRII